MVQISDSVASWIVAMGKRIIREAYNSEWDPVHPTRVTRIADEMGNIPPGGFIDEIDNMGVTIPMKHWLNAIVQLIRTITAVCAQDLEIDIPDDDSELTSAAAILDSFNDSD